MRTRFTLTILSLLITSAFAIAQPIASDIQWQKSFGGTGSDNAKSILSTLDGGFIVAGNSNLNNGNVTGNHGGNDAWIVKLDGSGNMQWQLSVGGSSDDYANSIIQNADSSYLVAGYTNSNNGDVTGNHGGSDAWLFKISPAGNLVWQKCYGGTGSDIANTIKRTSDSGYIICGYTGSYDGDVTGMHGGFDFWILKLNLSGNITWQKALGGTQTEIGSSIIETIDHNFVAVGYSTSYNGDLNYNEGYTDVWVVKLSASGTIIWQKVHGGVDYDFANDLKQTPDSGYIVVGSTKSMNIGPGAPNGSTLYADYYVLKLTPDGNQDWEQRVGGNNDESAASVHITPEGGFVIGGYASSYDGAVLGNETSGFYEYWLLKLSGTGVREWQKCLGGTQDDKAYSVQPTTDGYVLAGSSKSFNGDVTGNHGDNDFWVVKLRYTIDACPPAASTVITSDITFVNYSWEVNTGNGFTVISNNTNYSGATTSQLHLNNIPSSWYGYKYRYVMGRANGNIFYSPAFTIKFANSWTGTSSNAWEDVSNWSCGTLPDGSTDVTIGSGLSRYPVLNSNVSVRSLKLSEGATFSINPGFNLTITH